ncbi:MAG: RodZ domain-containing protein [Candidatus Sulfotelmatobacter sp.]
MGEFGDKFRKAREKKDISLDDVSNVTKISSRMLQAIEEERFDLLPGGVFNKGFIRAYAKHLGLNDEEAVTDYLACLRQAQIDAQQVWSDRPAAAPRQPAMPRPAPQARPDYQKPNLTKHGQVEVEEELPELQLPRAEDVRPPRKNFAIRTEPAFSWRFPAVAAVIIVLLALLWFYRSRGKTAESAPLAKSAQPASAVPSAPASSLAPNAGPANVPQGNSPTVANAATAASEKPASAPKTEAADNDANDVTVRTFPAAKPVIPAAKPVAPAKTIANLKLIIRASETTWISVAADGQPVAHETLIAPAAFSVRGTREIVVRIGNAAGVSFLFNDQDIPASGGESEVKTYVFDSSGMHQAATPEPAQAH